jgi:biofilm PGA synthesis N-glycosyltransferase PgaC
MGKVVYARRARAFVQDPTSLASWYKQTLRWLHGSMQGIRGHRIGRRLSWFSIAYSALILDWVLYVFFWPALLAWLVVDAVQTHHVLWTLGVYVGGYAIWELIGAVALRNWRMSLMFPTLIVMDWIQRGLFVHAFIKAWREPTSECKWVSPTRHDTREVSPT